MRTTRWLATAILAATAALGAKAEEVAGLPLHVKRLGPATVRVWLGDHISTTAQVAFATAKGIVVVDTFGDPEVDAALRGVIARELGRDDFAVLINTHEHGDHTGGNSVYTDCTIVGHDLVGAAMKTPEVVPRQYVEWVTARLTEAEKTLPTLPAASEQARTLREEIVRDRLGLRSAQSPPPRVVPTLTFSDRLTLDMGDTTFELAFVGGMHSASDTAIFVPEQGLLLTGDTMADHWLNDTPGCLAAYIARPGVRHDFPRLLANWERLLAHKENITMLLPGHWNGELSLEGAQARVAYVRTLWDGLHEAVAEGRSLGEVQAAYDLKSRFPELATSPGFSPQSHATTLAEIWKLAAHQASAAEALYALVDTGASETTVNEVLAEREKAVPAYYFTEAEINAAGYRFLRAGRAAEAVALFTVNVTLYPESWNVYDSLGEGLLATGETEAAKTMYERSLSLNPESRSGRDALERLQTQAEAAPTSP